ncbi:3-methyl-2-oxobutanoate hydroxymethyltransferase [Candidatus Chrysopegis kryptomonas]|uniref:3-methyl-2-oxobutanoate hydroxymethyltransferase n=1 Tax=Candidatus Chryseopegocella kryptomonas TaxID=1633643 RepID=A0A0P1NYR5_9BACT|nr:3-methyl-2-oxobutanoate hydroxymethyltransferase [Candidatus Chrysopegis kryptomonas]CUT04269.1 ketopantoate hydroxymethyltransferase [Candidatus Chrysopegis kryptomonas]
MKKVTTKTLIEMKRNGEKIAMLTAYDFIIAKLLDEAGIDVILVGDSLGNVFQGHKTTLPVTLEDMIYHTKAVCRGVKRAMVVVDMPFLTYQVSVEEAVKNCGRVLKETCAEAVKLEGGSEIVEVVKKLTSIGIPVMGHLGLTPQSIHKFGGYDVRGVDEKEAEKILNDAMALEQAGAFAIVLEKIPSELAKQITKSLSIPTIGIGAGPHCDGQVLVVYDMLGLFEEFKPKFVRRYAELSKLIKNAFENYIQDVKSGKFPDESESY